MKRGIGRRSFRLFRYVPAVFKQLQTYLHLTKCKLGFLLNFGEALMKDGHCQGGQRTGRGLILAPAMLERGGRVVWSVGPLAAGAVALDAVG